MHLISLDASRACAFYCCTALEPQSQMTFNEGFRIPVPANALAVCVLQLSVCSLGPQAQEELLVGLKASAIMTLLLVDTGVTAVQIKISCVCLQGKAQVSLADCEGNPEMVYHWLRVQMLSGTESQRPEQRNVIQRRHQDGQVDEQRPGAMVNIFYLVNNSNVRKQLDGAAQIKIS